MENFPRRVYHLSPRIYEPEFIAVAFAKASRSPKPYDELVGELDKESSRRFSEKWILKAGHATVAEHAILHLALENVSRLAIETVEGNRLASYTEKSTRYQQWNPKAYYVPEEIKASPFLSEYLELMDQLFSEYTHSLERLRSWVQENTPRLKDEAEQGWQNRVRLRAVDVSRYYLPAASLANVGVTMNARALEYALRKMASSDLEEVKAVGDGMKAVAKEDLPTFISQTDSLEYLSAMKGGAFNLTAASKVEQGGEWCALKSASPEGEDQILAAILYRFGEQNYQQCLDQLASLNPVEKQNLVDRLFWGMTDSDSVLRELEYCNYIFDITLDQGAYFEFKRHRMMTQTAQPLTTHLGYAIPKAISEAGLESTYREAMSHVALFYEKLAAWNQAVASYVVPNAFNRRVLCQFNLRELFHFARLRTHENAHFAIRRVAYSMLEQIRPIHPLFAQKITVSADETSQTITNNYFTATAESALPQV